MPAPVGTDGTDGTENDPATRFRDKRARRSAWNEWEASGGGLDDLPAGLVSAMLDACAGDGRATRWRR